MDITRIDNIEGYREFIEDLIIRTRTIQLKAARAVNNELVNLYWHIGNEILIRQNNQGWRLIVIDKLSQYLTNSFPTSEELEEELNKNILESNKKGRKE